MLDSLSAALEPALGQRPQIRLQISAAAPSDTLHQRRERDREQRRSEEHTSELQSLMRISYAVFCLKKKNMSNTLDKDTKPSSRTHKTTKLTYTYHETNP